MGTFACAATIVVDGSRVLLQRQRRSGVSAWEIPGGYVDPGESLEEAAAREAREEAGIDVVVGALAFTMIWRKPDAGRSNLIVAFEARPATTQWSLLPQAAEDIDEVCFVEREAVDLEGVHWMYREPLRRWLALELGSPPPHVLIDIGPNGEQRIT